MRPSETRSPYEDDNVANLIKVIHEQFGPLWREWLLSNPGNGQGLTDDRMKIKLARLASLIRDGAEIDRRIRESLERLDHLRSRRKAHADDQSKVA